MFTPKDFVQTQNASYYNALLLLREVSAFRESKESVGLQGPTVSVCFMSF